MWWLVVVVAGLLDVGMAVFLKVSHGFSRLLPTIAVAFFGISSFGLVSLAVRTLPIDSVYAIWTGLGIAGTAAIGMLVMGESVTLWKLISMALVVTGVVGLGLSGSGH